MNQSDFDQATAYKEEQERLMDLKDRIASIIDLTLVLGQGTIPQSKISSEFPSIKLGFDEKFASYKSGINTVIDERVTELENLFKAI